MNKGKNWTQNNDEELDGHLLTFQPDHISDLAFWFGKPGKLYHYFVMNFDHFYLKIKPKVTLNFETFAQKTNYAYITDCMLVEV